MDRDLIAVAIILIILSIALPKIGGDRMDANEMAVVRDLQTINTIQLEYKLGPPTGGKHGPQAANLYGYAFWL